MDHITSYHFTLWSKEIRAIKFKMMIQGNSWKETEIRRLEGALLFPDLTLMLESKYLLFSLSEIPSLIYFSRCNSFFRLLSFFSWVTISSGIRIRLNLDSVTMTLSMKEIRTNPNDCLSITAWCQISISKQERKNCRSCISWESSTETLSLSSQESLSFSLSLFSRIEIMSICLCIWYSDSRKSLDKSHAFITLVLWQGLQSSSFSGEDEVADSWKKKEKKKEESRSASWASFCGLHPFFFIAIPWL